MVHTKEDLASPKSSYLNAETISTSPQLARLLPRELASRFHAIPVALEGDQVTVAMAHPEDPQAREAIMSTLGETICLVQSKQEVIDRLLGQFWTQMDPKPLNISIFAPGGRPETRVSSYSESIAGLLGAKVNIFEYPIGGTETLRALEARLSVDQPDLLVLGPPSRSRPMKSPPIKTLCKITRRLSLPMLLAEGPRWPLRKILLPWHSLSGDSAALEWSIRLARPSGAQLTILPLMMPMPLMYASMRHSLVDLLKSDSLLGQEIREVAKRLLDEGIQGFLHLRQEPVDWGIHNETLEGDYDLVVIAGEPQKRVLRWLSGDLVGQLLRWIDRPVLLARPIN